VLNPVDPFGGGFAVGFIFWCGGTNRIPGRHSARIVNAIPPWICPSYTKVPLLPNWPAH